jgi:hypothetical protein
MPVRHPTVSLSIDQLLNQSCILYMQKGLHIAGRVTNQNGDSVAQAAVYLGNTTSPAASKNRFTGKAMF